MHQKLLEVIILLVPSGLAKMFIVLIPGAVRWLDRLERRGWVIVLLQIPTWPTEIQLIVAGQHRFGGSCIADGLGGLDRTAHKPLHAHCKVVIEIGLSLNNINEAVPASFCIFSTFQIRITILTSNICEIMLWPSSIRRLDFNPRPLEHKSPPITTRPGLPPTLFNVFLTLAYFC